MGLITEVEKISGTLNKHERNRLEREEQKAIESKLIEQSKELLLLEMLDYINSKDNAFILYQEEIKDLLINNTIKNLSKNWKQLQQKTKYNIISFLNIIYYTQANKAKTIYNNKKKYAELESIKEKVKEEQSRQEFYNINNIENVLKTIPNYKIKQKEEKNKNTNRKILNFLFLKDFFN